MGVAHDHGGFGPYTMDDLHAREDEGRGLELEDGWLIELSPSATHNWAAMRLQDIVSTAAAEAKADVFVAGGGEWEISTPAGIRKPALFLVPRSVARASIVDRDPVVIPGREVLLVIEVISPGSASERTDRVRKLKEYAMLGIPQYWIAEFSPVRKVQVFALEEGAAAYRRVQTATAGSVLEVEVEADESFTVRFDPAVLTEF
ncbi:Endonuclease, Uma2 family (restriction endonuclease fold) [Actinomadura meyerae]|uniref:Endonuclease, Uma2 family (Restriction endonuclease fold) n=2 Tax=Actinomadura meyerae TaxID=240840 RepID=A0A239GF67_9ACTN|nr:Endonuclease, Uma2 family (restriction endonuclease fold) [Actinomadura meyerae]